jgi:SAM-dependent MidA family methyltransferase
MDLEPGLHRDQRGDATGPGDEPALVEVLRTEIDRDGPMTFERFMSVTLYDPEHGYYRGPIARPSRAGDFLTAPELHPAFGRLLGRQIDEVWRRLDRPARFALRDHGAGSGTLGLTVVAGLRADRSDLAEILRYQPVELNRHRLADLGERWKAAGLADRVEPADGTVVGVVVANEFLDALPVHRVRQVDGQLRELFVTRIGDRFGEVAGPPSTVALAERLAASGIDLAEGQTAEICLAAEDWLAAAAASLELGLLLIIDYGHPAAELYGPRRRDGTLRVYAGHRVGSDPFTDIGHRDLTCHVDLTTVERVLSRAGLDPLGTTSLAEALVGLGIGELLTEAGAAEVTGGPGPLETYLELRAAVGRLLDPRALGGFAVVAFGRGVASVLPLAGLSWRLPARPT